LRKYLIVAIAALTVVAFATVAFAQAPDKATLTVKVTPKKAGTKKKPKNSTYTLNVVNGNTNRTMSALDVLIPKTVKLSLKGMPFCDPNTVIARGCPKSAILGTGEAKAIVGVNGTAPAPLTFKVQAFNTTSPKTGKPMLGFFIDDGGVLVFLTETTLTKAGGKYGQKLHIDVPPAAQKVGASTYNGLVSLKTTLKKKVGKKYLVSTVGCKKKKHPYKVTLHFIDNGITTAKSYGDTASAKCTK
jgi:hypothetical protein